MTYFPAFVRLENSKVLVIGGGRIATEKVGRLVDFTKDLTIVAPELTTELEELVKKHGLTCCKRTYKEGDLSGFRIVVVAVNDRSLQVSIAQSARAAGVLCNVVDVTDLCDFIFPSYIKRGELIIAFSSSGIAPAFSKYLRRAIERLIPPGIETFLEEMKVLRGSLPKGMERQRVFDQKAKDFVARHFQETEL